MELIWINRNREIYLGLNIHARINLKNNSGVSLWMLMSQHPDVLRNRIKMNIEL